MFFFFSFSFLTWLRQQRLQNISWIAYKKKKGSDHQLVSWFHVTIVVGWNNMTRSFIWYQLHIYFFFALRCNCTTIVTSLPTQHVNCSAPLTPAKAKRDTNKQTNKRKKTSHCRHVWRFHRSPQIHRRHLCLNARRLNRRRGRRVCIWWICADLISLCGQSLKQQRELVGSVSWWVVGIVGGQGLGWFFFGFFLHLFILWFTSRCQPQGSGKQSVR